LFYNEINISNESSSFSSGIGLGIARVFAQAKYNIIFNGLRKNGSEIAANVAREYQIDHLFSSANALRTDELQAMVNDGIKHFKHIGLLFTLPFLTVMYRSFFQFQQMY
jgi:NAD(P)-dependent dehydrogenase (short-subunit alcohol dehydrogenase family)